MKTNLLIRPVCVDCKKPLAMTVISIEGRCYKCHAAHERQPLLDEIEKLRAENKSLKGAQTVTGFFVVLKQEHDLYRHSSHSSACAEAERLAAKHPGRTFFVLGTSEAFRIGSRPDVLVLEMPSVSEENTSEEGDSIPF